MKDPWVWRLVFVAFWGQETVDLQSIGHVACNRTRGPVFGCSNSRIWGAPFGVLIGAMVCSHVARLQDLSMDGRLVAEKPGSCGNRDIRFARCRYRNELLSTGPEVIQGDTSDQKGVWISVLRWYELVWGQTPWGPFMDLYLDDQANRSRWDPPGYPEPLVGHSNAWRWMKMHGFAAVLHHIDNIFQINRCVLFDVVLQDLRGPVCYCMIIRTDFVIYHCAFASTSRVFSPESPWTSFARHHLQLHVSKVTPMAYYTTPWTAERLHLLV